MTSSRSDGCTGRELGLSISSAPSTRLRRSTRALPSRATPRAGYRPHGRAGERSRAPRLLERTARTPCPTGPRHQRPSGASSTRRAVAARAPCPRGPASRTWWSRSRSGRRPVPSMVHRIAGLGTHAHRSRPVPGLGTPATITTRARHGPHGERCSCLPFRSHRGPGGRGRGAGHSPCPASSAWQATAASTGSRASARATPRS